jgi:hypothetical protein
MAKTEESTYPAWWDWSEDADGDTVEGAFLRAGRGFTAQGERAFVVLDVDGTERTVWLHHDALSSAFSREVWSRPDKQLVEGEKIRVRQLGQRESKTGRTYMNYKTEFLDGPQSTHADIFGKPPEPPAYQAAEPEPGKGNGNQDDDVPF